MPISNGQAPNPGQQSARAHADADADADADEAAFVSAPQGLFTASGVWFQATEEELRDYAGPVLEHVSLGTLVRRAERWVHSPLTLAAWALPLLLVVWPPWAAAAGALVLYAAWTLASPSMVSQRGAQVAGWLELPWVQGLFYVLVLSFLAAQQRLAAVVVGLAGFLLLRWGLVGRLLRVPLRAAARRLYALPLEDQVLRAFILRAGLRHGVEMPQLERIRDYIARRWSW